MTSSNILRALLLSLLCVVVRLNAQVANANMNVIVHDGTGAVVPGASIKVTNNNTGSTISVGGPGNTLAFPFVATGIAIGNDAKSADEN